MISLSIGALGGGVRSNPASRDWRIRLRATARVCRRPPVPPSHAGLQVPGLVATPHHKDEVRKPILAGIGPLSAAKHVGRTTGHRWRSQRGGGPAITCRGRQTRTVPDLIERERIALCRREGFSIREISRRLGRSPSTINPELRRSIRCRRSLKSRPLALGEVSSQHSTKIWSVKMARRGCKRNLNREDEYWKLLFAGIGPIAAAKSVGIGHTTRHRWRSQRGGLAPLRLA